MDIKKFEVCETVRIGTSNPVTKFFVTVFNESAPGLVHICPYKLVNVTKGVFNVNSVGSLVRIEGDHFELVTIISMIISTSSPLETIKLPSLFPMQKKHCGPGSGFFSSILLINSLLDRKRFVCKSRLFNKKASNIKYNSAFTFFLKF